MRIIKFRAWDKKRKTMNYQKSDHPTFGNHAFDFGDLFYYAKDNLVAMQFTGLLDENGVEIYEGDIVTSWYSKSFNWEVYWDEQRWWLRNKQMNRDYGDENCCDDQETSIHLDKVIGNIYENPELLEVTNEQD